MSETLGIVGRTERYFHELQARKDLLVLPPSPIVFDLPMRIRDIHGVEVGSSSHDKAKGLFGAIDLLAHRGARVKIPDDALIVDVVHGYGEGGAEERFKDLANRVVLGIRLNEVEFVYMDFMHVSPTPEVIAARGSTIANGSTLGVVDSSGWTTEPHLHMFAQRIFLTPETGTINPYMTKPLRIRFLDKYLMNFHARFLYPR